MSVSGTRARPCGSWSSSISSERIAAGALRLAQPRLDGGWVYWLEGRPAEGGRQAILRGRPAPGGAVEEVTPPDVHVRTRVHEYGGGDYGVWDGRVLYVELASQAIHATRGAAPSCAAGSSHADLALSPDGRWLVAVEERPRPHPSEAQEPENRLVVFAADGSDALRPVAEGHDFVSSPRFSPDGRQLAFLAWEHPAMPWDETRLYVQAWGAGGPEGAPRPVAGGAGESIFQPEYSPQGRLTFVSDRTGWWNLYQFDVDVDVGVDGDGAGARPLCPREAEFGRPQWGFAMS
ncbi:MAG: S9 family peptidase, partial [Proteobacteria bacterium]|nr:S9 family peptidase [Pseudomonadota bacterium]